MSNQRAESAEAFTVTFLGEKVRVVSPKTPNEFIAMILINRSMHKIIGKVHNLKTNKEDFFSVDVDSELTLKVDGKIEDIINIVPLSPPGQEVELRTGKEAYEIPAKK